MVTGYGLQVGHASDVGRVRQVNEDSYLVLTPPAALAPIDALLLVADGVGGENAGEVASGMLVQSFADWFQGRVYEDLVHFSPTHPDYFIAVMKELMELANEHIHHASALRPELAHMGTTTTAVLISNGRAFVGHVGDTRAYLFRNGELTQLTNDHSWVAEEVAAGRMTSTEAHNHPRRNVVTRVVGNGPLVRVDRMAAPLEIGDVLLLASDGLTGVVSDEELRQFIIGGRPMADLCANCIRTANERGGEDNITVLTAQVTADGRIGGVEPDGVTISSTYLGRSAAAAKPEPIARRRKVAGARTTQVMAAQPVNPSRRSTAAGYLLVVLVLLAAVALAFGVMSLVQNPEALHIGTVAIAPDRAAGIVSALALLLGFLLGFLGQRWLSENR